jgi:Domain of unknown function DUF1828
MSTNPCEAIQQSVGKLFTCSPLNGYTRIRTPFLYPDGDVIDVYLKETDGVVTLTDLGETLRWLRMQSLSSRRSPKQQKLVEDVCLTHGLELFRGMLVLRATEGQSIGNTVTRLAQGALRVADLGLTMRTRSVDSATDEVEEFLKEKSVPFQRGETLVGRSGKSWQIDFHTRSPHKSSLVCLLSTGSKGAARSITDHVVATWYDLNHLKLGPEALQFVSLFDDTLDVWSTEDFRLVDDISEIARWSKREDFAEKIAA